MPDIFSDNFDSYSGGSLSGQGSWTAVAPSSFSVQGAVVKAGAMATALWQDVQDKKISKPDPSPQASGSLSVYMRRTSAAVRGGMVSLWERDNERVRFEQGANWFRYLDNLAAWQNFPSSSGSFGADIWYKVQCEWQLSGGSAKSRFTADDGAWTAWIVPWSGDWVSLGSMNLQGNSQASAGTQYMDEILGEYPSAPEVAGPVSARKYLTLLGVG